MYSACRRGIARSLMWLCYTTTHMLCNSTPTLDTYENTARSACLMRHTATTVVCKYTFLRLTVNLAVCLSVRVRCLSNYQSSYCLSVCLSVCQATVSVICIDPSRCLSVCLSVCPSALSIMSIYPYFCVAVCQSIFLSIYLWTGLSVSLSYRSSDQPVYRSSPSVIGYPPTCLSVCLSVSLRVNQFLYLLSVCPPVNFSKSSMCGIRLSVSPPLWPFRLVVPLPAPLRHHLKI